MSEFTALERAALRAIFSENPDLESQLEAQAAKAIVIKRENTGGGFFTDISIPEACGPISSKSPLGDCCYAKVDGLEHGLGLLLFLEEGRMTLLEGYAIADENTKPIDFGKVKFEITAAPT